MSRTILLASLLTGAATLLPASASAQSLELLWYDGGQEADGAGVTTALEAAGHTVHYRSTTSDGVIDLTAPSWDELDLVVVEGTAGAGTVTGVESWLRSGRGYVALVDEGMYDDVEDDATRALLEVTGDGEPEPAVTGVEDWDRANLTWAAPEHPAARWPNDGTSLDLSTLVASGARSHAALPGGLPLVVDEVTSTTAVVLADHLEALGAGSGRVALVGASFSGADREVEATAALLENLLAWAAGDHCGNGLVEPSETCDDGDTDDLDGCDASCEVEHGFSCEGEPSVCDSSCGDGVIASDEACDDGNSDDDDGCSADCGREHGFSCTGEPSECTSSCGDGQVATDEECDDQNERDGDGCSAECLTEAGYQCISEPSRCEAVCGDGAPGGFEQCDDGDLDEGDGCSATCRVERGWSCDEGSPTACMSICGDGMVVGPEGCDDGDLDEGDGCDQGCAVESGWRCDTSSPSRCCPDADGDDRCDEPAGCDCAAGGGEPSRGAPALLVLGLMLLVLAVVRKR